MKPCWNCMVGSMFFVLACGVLVGSASCDSDQQADTPTSEEYDAIARGIAPLVSVELKTNGILETSTQIVVGDDLSWLRIDSTGNLQGSVGGLTWDVLAECQTWGNDDLEVCDESTDTAQLTALVNGSLTLPNYAAALDVDSQWSFEGLQGPTIHATGKTKISADSEFDSLLTAAAGVGQFDLDFDFDFLIPIDEYEATSGTGNATVDVYFSKTSLDGSHIEEGQFVVDAELSLDGNGHAILTLDGVAQYQLNLEASLVIRI